MNTIGGSEFEIRREPADVLVEFEKVRQIPEEPKRRWFSAKGVDLIVWLDDADKPIGFQLCYMRGDIEHAFTWEIDRGFNHSEVDPGEAGRVSQKRSPILRATSELDKDRLMGPFKGTGRHLPSEIYSLVIAAIESYPDAPAIKVDPPNRGGSQRKKG